MASSKLQRHPSNLIDSDLPSLDFLPRRNPHLPLTFTSQVVAHSVLIFSLLLAF